MQVFATRATARFSLADQLIPPEPKAYSSAINHLPDKPCSSLKFLQKPEHFDSHKRSRTTSTPKIFNLKTLGTVALAAAFTKSAHACPARCFRSESMDALYLTIAAGTAGVICSPTVIADVICAGGTVAAVTSYIAHIKQECAQMGCGPYYSP